MLIMVLPFPKLFQNSISQHKLNSEHNRFSRPDTQKCIIILASLAEMTSQYFEVVIELIFVRNFTVDGE